MMIRSFLAFELPPDIKRVVVRVSEDIKRSTLDLRRVKVDNIHLTVVFMGNIRPEDVSAIGEVIDKVCVSFSPFDIFLKGLGVFPNIRKPRVLWLGLDGEIERMSLLRDDLQQKLKPFGIKEEKREFRAHLTLGRFGRPVRGDSRLEDITSQYKDLSGPLGQMDELIMFKSELKPGGAEYTRLESWSLSGENSTQGRKYPVK
ncbi:RNA 2',3'-cyclic phosphodiesterase [Thermodesulfobacteriota bacterium]